MLQNDKEIAQSLKMILKKTLFGKDNHFFSKFFSGRANCSDNPEGNFSTELIICFGAKSEEGWNLLQKYKNCFSSKSSTIRRLQFWQLQRLFPPKFEENSSLGILKELDSKTFSFEKFFSLLCSSGHSLQFWQPRNIFFASVTETSLRIQKRCKI